MGAYWLHDLPDVIAAAGIPVRVWAGWETRSRGSGGYDAVWAVGVHHDASSPNADVDGTCRYLWETAEDNPIGAIYLDRSGLVTVGAAGATNTQGKGGPYTTSRGVIPLDQGNRYTLSIEAANNGVGEPWPTIQQDAYVALCAALCEAYDLDPARDVLAHFEWTTRKIDPAGPSEYASGSASWRMGDFRGDVMAVVNPPIIEEEIVFIWRHTKYADAFVIGAGALHANQTVVKKLRAQGVPDIVEADNAMLDYVCAASGFDKAKLKPV